MIDRTTSFHCTEGSSNKAYSLTLRGTEADGYRVLTQYGPRGGRMTQGEKTTAPLPLDKAEKLFEKECKARIAKGYRVTDSDEPVLVGLVTKEDSGLRPQLLNPVSFEEAEALVRDPDFFMQIKHDGERLMVRASTRRIEGINRKGQLTTLPIEIVNAIGTLPLTERDTVIDGERLGTSFAPFDLVELDGDDLRPWTAEARVECLATYIGGAAPAVIKSESAHTTAQKRALFDRAKAINAEGVVFKRRRAPYTPGRPASGGDQLKCKFVETASVRVESVKPDKRSIGMEVRDDAGVWHFVGHVTVPPNLSIPNVGDIVEVRYLYQHGPTGGLAQPWLLGVRTDLDNADCTLVQLKQKNCDALAAA